MNKKAPGGDGLVTGRLSKYIDSNLGAVEALSSDSLLIQYSLIPYLGNWSFRCDE